MSELFHFQAGDWSLKQGHFDAAVRHFEKVLSSSTGHNRIVGLFELGEAFKLNYCINAAILCYEKVLSMLKEDIDAKVSAEIRRATESNIEFCNGIRNIRSTLNTIFQPIRMSIEPINSCNYSCYKCLYPKMKRKKTRLDPERYEKFLSSWARRFGEFEEIIFTGGGEALLHKRLPEIIRISSKWMPHSRLSIGTNLSLLTETLARELIDAGLKNWEVSFDTDDRDEYRKITGVNSFDIVIKNIEMLWDALDKGKKGALEVAAHRPFDEHYFDKIGEIASLIRGMCTNLRHSPYSTLMGRKNSLELELWEQSMNFDAPIHGACLELWGHLVVTSDGNIRRCCSDMFDCPDQETLGNIFKQTLDEIINNENRRTVQNKIRVHDIKDLYLCGRCHCHYQDTSIFKVGYKYS